MEMDVREERDEERFAVRLAYALKPGLHGLFFPGVSFGLVDFETREEVFVVEPSPNNITGDAARVKPVHGGGGGSAQRGRHRGRGRGRGRGRAPGGRVNPGSLLIRDEFGWCMPSMPVIFIDESHKSQVLVAESDTRCYGYVALCGMHACMHRSRVYVISPPVPVGATPGKHWDPESRKGGSLTKQEREVVEMRRAGSLDKNLPDYVVEATHTSRGVDIYRVLHGDRDHDGESASAMETTTAAAATHKSKTTSGEQWSRVLVASMTRMMRPVDEESPLIGAPWNVPADGWQHFEVRIDDSHIDAALAISVVVNAVRESYCCFGCSSFRFGVGMGMGRGGFMF